MFGLREDFKGRELDHGWTLAPALLPGCTCFSLSLGKNLPDCWDGAHRDVDLDAIAVPSGLVHLRFSITAEGVIGDFQGGGEGAVFQEDSGGEFLWTKSGCWSGRSFLLPPGLNW